MTENEEEVQNVEAGSEDKKQLLVRIDTPDELKAGTYANHVVISRTPHEFVITFAQIMPLRDEEAVEEARKAGRLEAVAVANIAIAHGLLESVINAFQTQLDNSKDEGKSD